MRGYATDPESQSWAKNSNPQPLFSSKNSNRFHVAITFLLMMALASATTTDNILSNFGSDAAPLLALFGEKITIEYLGELLSWIHNLIFAIAPLGIITAIVSTI